jgi:hypothetical protein
MSRTPTSEDCAIITVIPVNSTVVTITTAEAAGRPERRGPAAGAAPIGHDLWILVRCTGAVGHLLLAKGPADDRAWDDHQAARTCSPPSGVCLWGVVLRHCHIWTRLQRQGVLNDARIGTDAVSYPASW